MEYDPERVGNQKIDDDQIAKAQQGTSDEQTSQSTQRAMGSTALDLDGRNAQHAQQTQQAMGSTATSSQVESSPMDEEEEESQSM